MKKVLSLLVAFVFLQTQSWALSGGPKYPTVAVNCIGTFSGVLVPTEDAPASNVASIGLFSFAQAKSGPASGAFLSFINGAVFIGTIQGLIDPKGGIVYGVLDATSSFDVVGQNGGPATKLFASGSMEGKIVRDYAFGSAARIEGTATLGTQGDIGEDGIIPINGITKYQIDGFQQSVDAAKVPAFNFGNNAAPAN